MTRKLELAKMMFHSLMSDMGVDEKLSFLTEVFCITEDLRHELSQGDTNEEKMQSLSGLYLQDRVVKVPCGTSDGQERSNEVNE